jgi:flagellar hook protein FlgE
VTDVVDEVARSGDERSPLGRPRPFQRGRVAGQEVCRGQLAISQFPNSGGLQANGQNVLTATPASGQPTLVAPGAANAPTVVAGALEGSNVDVTDEFTRMIQAQRGYQLNSKVVQAWDDLARMANDLRSA